MFYRFRLFLLLLSLSFGRAIAQTCPDNIDFVKGDFSNWVCDTGRVLPNGQLNLKQGPPVFGQQSLSNNKNTATDYYGKFPITAPNGSIYTCALGNSQTQRGAEKITYTYTIPADKNDYIITYYYAVVLQLTKDHLPYERPRFSVKLSDLTAKQIVSCGTHDFISGDGLGDFKKSERDENVEFRDWSTVAINLSGLAGHTIAFEFITNDCSKGGHFGYAYLAFDDPCETNKEPITGTNYCAGANSVTLSAPLGFSSYQWREAGSATVVSYERKYVISPVPADGAKYTVDAVASTGVGQGCPASFAAVVHKVDEPYAFALESSLEGCESKGVDLTDPALKKASAGMQYKYYEDADLTVIVRDPTAVTKSGRYYIRGTNKSGCTDVREIQVNLIPDPVAKIKDPKPVCVPGTIDLTDPVVTGGFNTGLKYEYFSDASTKVPLQNPDKIAKSGTYYLKITNSTGCAYIQGINARILVIPVVKPASLKGCSPFNIDQPQYHNEDTQGLTYKYYRDAAGSLPLEHPEAMTDEGTFYAVGVNEIGCTSPVPVPVIVSLYPKAELTIDKPGPVRYPQTIDLTNTFLPISGYTYSYYYDSLATKTITSFRKIDHPLKAFIKAVNASGCQVIKSVEVSVTAPDEAAMDAGTAFTPNGDGVNDTFAPAIKGYATLKYLKIYNRSGGLVFQTTDLSKQWNGMMNSIQVPSGTYYWVCQMHDIYRDTDSMNSGYVAVIR